METTCKYKIVYGIEAVIIYIFLCTSLQSYNLLTKTASANLHIVFYI